MLATHKVNLKFHPGRIAATPAIIDKVTDTNYLIGALVQHLQGKWGLIDPEDWDSNDRALQHGGRLLSVYPLPDSEENFYIITEADRSVTTFLLPSDY
jgi:hypothetical protein